MPRFLLAALAASVVATALLIAPAAAQRPGPPPGGPGGPRRPPGALTPDSILAEMSTRLKLTAAQKAKIKPILVDQQKKMVAIFQDQSIPQDKKRAQLMALRDTYRAKLKKVLTPDQQKQYDQWEAEMRARFSRPPGGPPGGPPPR